MKKSINIFIKMLLIMAIVIPQSCSDDFLDLKPQQSLEEDNAMNTIDKLDAAITGIYEELNSSNYYGRYIYIVPDVMSDDVKQNAGANRAVEFAQYQANPDLWIPEGLWEDCYQVIDRANRVIHNETDFPDAVQGQADFRKGEAYALRALAHFDLVKMYAQHYTFTDDASHLGVPIKTKIDAFQKPERNTVQEVYTQIVSDFQDALTLMQASQNPSSSGTLSTHAVKALLSRVYLYMEDWENAADMATDVISDGPYGLFSHGNYFDIFSQDFNKERIFEVVFTPAGMLGSDCMGGLYLSQVYGDYLPSDDLLDTIPAGDARKRIGALWGEGEGEVFTIDPSLAPPYDSLRVNKWPDPNGEQNITVIRLAEVYLNRAEAYYHMDQPGDAQTDLNTIRQRGLPSAPDVTATGQALLDEILLERRRELCFEGHRLFDLMRYQKDMIRDDCTGATCTVTYPDGRFILPIPVDEMDVNPNMIQNPAYD